MAMSTTSPPLLAWLGWLLCAFSSIACPRSLSRGVRTSRALGDASGVLHGDATGRRQRQAGCPRFGGQQAAAFGGLEQALLDLCLLEDPAGDQRVQTKASVEQPPVPSRVRRHGGELVALTCQGDLPVGVAGGYRTDR